MSNNSKRKTVWVDNRTEEEFLAGHIEGAILLPYDEIEARHAELDASFEDDIRLYCKSGRRSGVAKDILTGLGYKNVTNEGGYEDLK